MILTVYPSDILVKPALGVWGVLPRRARRLVWSRPAFPVWRARSAQGKDTLQGDESRATAAQCSGYEIHAGSRRATCGLDQPPRKSIEDTDPAGHKGVDERAGLEPFGAANDSDYPSQFKSAQRVPVPGRPANHARS